MADGDVTFDDGEIQRILNSAALEAEVRQACNAIMARARSITPPSAGAEYIDGFTVEIEKWRQLRIVGFVVNHSKNAIFIESRYGILAKARRAR